MANQKGGSSRRLKDEEMAAYMKKMGIHRKFQICPLCYHNITVEGLSTRYKHICRGGK